MNIGKWLVDWIIWLKKRFNCHIYHIEQAIVAIILVSVALITKKWYIERIWVIAVFLTFWHASVADRLEEHERHRQSQKKDEYWVWCYYKLQHYYYAKEICWTIYFVFLGAWSALVWVVIFLLYWPRRKLYRKYNPIS